MPASPRGGLNHLDEGSGEPALVLVHGFTCALDDWDAQRARFAGERRVIALDLPGHGASPPGDGVPSVAAFGRRVADLVDALGAGRAVLVGHSLGCRVVLEAAGHLAGRLAGLALVDGSRLGSGGAEAARRALADRVAADGWERFSGAFFADMFTPASDPALRSRIVARAEEMPAAFAVELIADAAAWDAGTLDGALSALRAPLLAVQSTRVDERRRRVPLGPGESTPWLEGLAARVPGARIEVVPGVGHFTQIEAAGTVNRLLDEFLRAL